MKDKTRKDIIIIISYIALVIFALVNFSKIIAFLGKVFINLMFCIVVPLVFSSIAGSVANMDSRQRAGKIMATTIGTFVVTGAHVRADEAVPAGAGAMGRPCCRGDR